MAAPALVADKPVGGAETVRFAVLSDLHYYDSSLGTEGPDYERYLVSDLKMLHLAKPILEAAIEGVVAQDVRFVVIAGDLTKDGEWLNHRRLTEILRGLEHRGVQVYVVPGNHDINNHDAVAYTATGSTPVRTIGPAQFADMYSKFGYDQALDRAPDSLSYVAEPARGLWLLMLDSAKWAESAGSPHPLVSGRLSGPTLYWAMAKLQEAALLGKRVVAVMHHNINPHFMSEPLLFSEYLLDDFGTAGYALGNLGGLKAIFTGHYHSLDAAWQMDASYQYVPGSLLDIETPSLLSLPCAYRIGELDLSSGQLSVTSQRVTDIGVDLGIPFQDYAELFDRTLLPFGVEYRLSSMFPELFPTLPPEVQDFIISLVVDALIANYAGNEQPDAATMALISEWTTTYPAGHPFNTLGQLLATLWLDPPPGDETLSVDLAP